MPTYKQPDGTYLVKVNYKDIAGNYKQIVRKNKETATKAGAQKVEARLIVEVSQSPADILKEKEAKILETMTYADLVEDYLSVIAPERRASTLKNKRQHLEQYLLPSFGKIRINDFTPSLIQAWKAKLNVSTSPRTGQPLGVIYKNNLLKDFKASLKYAETYYGYANTAYKRITSFADPSEIKEKEKIQFWSYDQFNAAMKEFKRICEEREASKASNYLRSWGVYVLFHILFFCGLRKGEATPLSWTDIQKKGNYYALRITKSLDQKNGYQITPPKNKSSVRSVPICNQLLTVLKEHYDRYASKCAEFSPQGAKWYICGGLTPIPNTTLEKAKNELCEACNLPKIRIHDFRHSFVTLLINSNINIKTISKLVGHATVDQTWNTYGHLYPEKENEAIELINQLGEK